MKGAVGALEWGTGAMDDSQGGGRRRKAAEELILRTIAAHADSLLRTARRHSICVDDAQDAYQRAIEIFMGHAAAAGRRRARRAGCTSSSSARRRRSGARGGSC